MDTNLKISSQPLIGEVGDRMRAQLSGNPSALVATLDPLILAGQQRVRPSMTLLLGSMFEVEREDLLNLAAAVEMMQTATLIHDDLGAESEQRPGLKNSIARFSTSATVLAGDLAFAAAAQLATATKRIEVMQKFSETLQFIINGEITYMFSNGNGRDAKAYYAWIHAKTAALFELASGMAATLGSANLAEIAAAYQFGYHTGMAFQIMEDVLDFAGDPSILGRPAGNNLRQGMITLPTLLYLQAHPGDLDIRAILKSNGNGHSQIEGIITDIRQSEAIDQAAQKADHFVQQGLDSLARLPDTPERAELAGLASGITRQSR